MKQYRIICSILLASILCSICLLVGCSGQTALNDEKFAELIALTKGEIPLMKEFEGGLEANADKVINTGEYYNGGIIYRLKDETRQNLRLFFILRGDTQELAVISADEGAFFDILIGDDTFEDIKAVLGEPSYATEKDDMYELPHMSYYYPHGQLSLCGNENHTITEVTFKADTK